MKRFWSKVDSSAGSKACWPWLASRLPRGYGRFSVGGRNGRITTAHRVAYELVVGPVPSNLFVLHSCDTPYCVNPRHLHLGTHLDNMAEMRARGRSRVGEKNVNAKLSVAVVHEIRRLDAMRVSNAEIARRFNVHRTYIWAIKNRRAWAVA